MNTFLAKNIPVSEVNIERKERVLDAPVLSFNLLLEIEKLKDEIAWRTGSKDSKTLYKNPAMKIVLVALHAGAKIFPNQTEGVLSLQVLEGKIKVRTNNETLILIGGQLVTIHEKIVYEARAMEESFVLLTTSLDKYNYGE